MVEIMLWGLAVCLVCAIVIVELLARAPRGYEDDDGFHYGRRPPRDEQGPDDDQPH